MQPVFTFGVNLACRFAALWVLCKYSSFQNSSHSFVCTAKNIRSRTQVSSISISKPDRQSFLSPDNRTVFGPSLLLVHQIENKPNSSPSRLDGFSTSNSFFLFPSCSSLTASLICASKSSMVSSIKSQPSGGCFPLSLRLNDILSFFLSSLFFLSTRHQMWRRRRRRETFFFGLSVFEF